MDWLGSPGIWANLLTLTALEIVLGIDNLVFVAVLAGRLPAEQQGAARTLGLALALIARLFLLASIAWIIGLKAPLFDLFGHTVSWRDIFLFLGGLFLLYSATQEIHRSLEGADMRPQAGAARVTFGTAIAQIVLLDMIFSLDSVITAVGMSDQLWVMATAIIIAIAIMLVAAKPLSSFVESHPTVKMLTLSFLFMIGMTLIADGAGFHVPRGYIYAAIGFSIAVETLNQLAARRNKSH